MSGGLISDQGFQMDCFDSDSSLVPLNELGEEIESLRTSDCSDIALLDHSRCSYTASYPHPLLL